MEYFLRLIFLNKDTCTNFRCHFANDDGKQQLVLLTFVKNLQLTKLTNIFMKRIFVKFDNCAIVIVIC
jgi:hypothetical protein